MPWSISKSGHPAKAQGGRLIDQARQAQEGGNWRRAEELFRLVLNQDPNHSAARYSLGLTLIHQGRLPEARETLAALIKAESDHVDACVQLGYIELLVGDYAASATHQQNAISLDPGHAVAHNLYAAALRHLGQYDLALEERLRAIEIDRNFDSAWVDLGQQHLDLGQLDEGVAALLKAIDINLKNTTAYLHLAASGHHEFSQDEIQKMTDLYENSAMMPDRRSYLAFALGRIAETQKDYDQAFRYFERGNRLRRQGIRFSVDDERKRFTEFSDVFGPEDFRRDSDQPSSRPGMIFIAGMPRSGTSLIEQILASHPDVFGAGETSILDKLCDDQAILRGAGYPAFIKNLSPADVLEIRGKYLDSISHYQHESAYVVDKSLGNFRHVGFIRMLFPDARLLHCRRDPMANCVSLFRNVFSGSMTFAYDQDDLGQFYRVYADYMNFWQETYPGEMHDCVYEDLTEDPEVFIRELLEFCGLKFDPACLDFHKTSRAVRTLSSSQVRKPIYRDAVAAWKRYESNLEPLKMALGELSQGWESTSPATE
jgi:tetratricopeptide (TPR) repeat protein